MYIFTEYRIINVDRIADLHICECFTNMNKTDKEYRIVCCYGDDTGTIYITKDKKDCKKTFEYIRDGIICNKKIIDLRHIEGII